MSRLLGRLACWLGMHDDKEFSESETRDGNHKAYIFWCERCRHARVGITFKRRVPRPSRGGSR